MKQSKIDMFKALQSADIELSELYELIKFMRDVPKIQKPTLVMPKLAHGQVPLKDFLFENG